MTYHLIIEMKVYVVVFVRFLHRCFLRWENSVQIENALQCYTANNSNICRKKRKSVTKLKISQTDKSVAFELHSTPTNLQQNTIT